MGLKNFVTYALIFAFYMAAAGAPSPLYEVYQKNFVFSSLMLTVIFAVYSISLLATLLVLGPLSDYIGRKPVLLAALAFEIAGMAIFSFSSNLPELILARIVQGFATGLATAVLSAALFDTQPKERKGLAPVVNTIIPVFNLGLGAVFSAYLASRAPYPLQLIYWLLIVCFLFSMALLYGVPETSTGKKGWKKSLKPTLKVPKQARDSFVVVGPALVAAWALAGLYLSLGPSIVSIIMNDENPLSGGLIILTLTSTSSLSSFLLRKNSDRRLVLIGSGMSPVGLAVTAFGILAANASIIFVGTAIGGIGLGSAFTGAFRSIMGRSTPEDRASLSAAIYTVSYLAFGIPVIFAGIGSDFLGLEFTALIYDLFAIALFCLTLLLTVTRKPLGLHLEEIKAEDHTS